ncbi:unnamed protein product [Ostreobium quekettii]|uniref:Ribosomal RNA-processing protein 8 n=1 Tax=Ostreobium quekettii TaxID=121088 RepID=A0A8S1JBB4_9CHLO|nr:unnamed protein product [Ostreobium quekettii]|eukprot:evm.model.scf_1973.2 EVM.evm.TU.scf_1973.2   scf_1973:28260-30778(-)
MADCYPSFSWRTLKGKGAKRRAMRVLDGDLMRPVQMSATRVSNGCASRAFGAFKSKENGDELRKKNPMRKYSNKRARAGQAVNPQGHVVRQGQLDSREHLMIQGIWGNDKRTEGGRLLGAGKCSDSDRKAGCASFANEKVADLDDGCDDVFCKKNGISGKKRKDRQRNRDRSSPCASKRKALQADDASESIRALKKKKRTTASNPECGQKREVFAAGEVVVGCGDDSVLRKTGPKGRERKRTAGNDTLRGRDTSEAVSDEPGAAGVAAKSKAKEQSAQSDAKRKDCAVENTNFASDDADVDLAAAAKKACDALHEDGREEIANENKQVQKGRIAGFSRPRSKLLAKLHDRLMSGHFRHINELLYMRSGNQSYEMMRKDKELFEAYHKDYQQQMKCWAKQPVDQAIAWLRKSPKDWKVADFGCGNAKLAASVEQEVTSLDLVALAPGVIECNMADTPLTKGSQHVAIFSLALMGTDYFLTLQEAARVLRRGGILWLAEVRSRFMGDDGHEAYDDFSKAMGALGFKRLQLKKPSELFVVMVFRKTGKQGSASNKSVWPVLKACVYKKR